MFCNIICFVCVTGSENQSSTLTAYISNLTIATNISEAKYNWTMRLSSSPYGSLSNFSLGKVLQVLQLSTIESTMSICKVKVYEAGI